MVLKRTVNCLRDITLSIDEKTRVSALLLAPLQPRACLVFGHGAGAGMRHASMSLIAEELATLGIATLRYQFPYMEQGGKRPDPPPRCHAVVRKAVEEATRQLPGVPLIAGGRSFGGRMTSQTQAIEPLPLVRGLVFFAFPLHPAKQPSTDRAAHLSKVRIPMLFLQGTRDALASLELLEPLVEQLGPHATLRLAQDADHSFHVPVKSGRTDAEVRKALLDEVSAWVDEIKVNSGRRTADGEIAL
jgi:predicted alpha/beta-hydrolase family hydrolase